MHSETTYGPASLVLATARPYRYIRQYATKSGERRYALMERSEGGRARRVGTAKLYSEVREFFRLPEQMEFVVTAQAVVMADNEKHAKRQVLDALSAREFRLARCLP